jgi:hypothetical protein
MSMPHRGPVRFRIIISPSGNPSIEREAPRTIKTSEGAKRWALVWSADVGGDGSIQVQTISGDGRWTTFARCDFVDGRRMRWI